MIATLTVGQHPFGIAIGSLSPARPLFIRCDANDDGRSDIADALWILNELFYDGAPTACRAAADCDADGRRDIADVVHAVSYQLKGDDAPPPPFPDCGPGDGPSDGECPFDSTRC